MSTHGVQVSGGRLAVHLLADGGLAFPSPGSFDVDEVLHSVIGPAMDRLSMTFDDEAAYLRHWSQHPAIGPLLDSPAALRRPARPTSGRGGGRRHRPPRWCTNIRT